MKKSRRFEIRNGNLYVLMHGLRRLFALRSELVLPLSDIGDVLLTSPDSLSYPGIKKIYGTNLPGVYYGGVFWQNKEKEFWDARWGREVIVLSLKNQKFAWVIVDSDNPSGDIEWLKNQLASKQ